MDLEERIKIAEELKKNMKRNINEGILNGFTESVNDGPKLTYDLLHKLHKRFEEELKAEKLNKNWFTPFAKDGNNTYFVSHGCYNFLAAEFLRLNKSNAIPFYKDINSFYGIEIIFTSRIEDFGFYYEDKYDSQKLHPVLICEDEKFIENFKKYPY